MLKENHNLEDALKKYLCLLKEQCYFEAHEALEEAWHPLRKANHPSKNLVKGLINGAIAFEHIKRNQEGRQRKANIVIGSFERYKSLLSKELECYALLDEACNTIESLKQEHNTIFEEDS
jgi:hypothetical protein